MDYSIVGYAKTAEHGHFSMTIQNKATAITIAKEMAAKYPTHTVYIRCIRESDRQVGYVTPGSGFELKPRAW